MTRGIFAVLFAALVVAGCHGTDLRVGTGHTRADGGSSGSIDGDGCRGGGGAWNVENGDSTSLWVELGFQLTPQTVIVRHADDHGLEPLYPPRPIVEQLAADPPPQLMPPRAEPLTPQSAPAALSKAGPGIDDRWLELALGIVGLLMLLAGGGYTARGIRRRRRRRKGGSSP